ncbi:hypothetical protein ACQBAR_15115 [Propionibacteriaceae bacterium Y1685]
MSQNPYPASDALARLRAWRQAGITEQRPGFQAIRDIHLSMVARSGRRNEAAIAEILPASLKGFAGGMAQALTQAPPTAGARTGPPPAPAQPPAPGQAAPGQTAPGQTAPGRPAQQPPAAPARGPRPSASHPASAAPPASSASAPVPDPRLAPDPGSAAAPGRPAGRPPQPQAPAPSAPSAQPPTGPPPETQEQRQQRLALEWEKFAPLDFSAMGGEPGRIQASSAPGGAIRLRWQPPAEDFGHTVYRVVSGDDYAPYDPQTADFIEITTETECVDPRPFTSAVRHLQVWRNSGTDEADARSSQPVLHAQVPVVSPVQDLDLREDEGRVIGQWTTFPRIGRVQVFRVPIERAQHGFGDPTYRILADEANLGGFVDNSAERGRRYVYQFLCEAEHDGLVRLSAPVTKPLLVSAVLVGVDDLAIRLHGSEEDPQFDLSWTNPPAGRVLIFRTETPPRSGAASEVQDQSVLPQMNLADDSRLAHPIVQEEGRAAMRDVPWPRDWVRTYFTPVTLLDGRVQVGQHIPAVRTRGVSEPVVVERTHTQVLKFGWPTGAAEVSVFLGAKGQDSAQLMDTATRMDISAKDYERLGGMQFSKPLPSAGCSVHMVGVSYSAGERVESEPVSVEYPGLLRLSYAVEQRRGMLGRGIPAVLIKIASEIELDHAPPFVLVFNDDRFPLDKDDGEALEVMVDSDQVAMPTRRFIPPGLRPEWSPTTWKAAVHRPGFVRLFLDLDPARLQSIALLDPDVNSLIIRG